MTIQIKHLTTETQEWDRYVASKNASLYFFNQWRVLVKSVFGHNDHYIFAQDNNGNMVGVLPLIQIKSLLFGNYLVSMPYFNYGGLLADNNDISQMLLDYSEKLRIELGCSHVELRQEQTLTSDLPVRQDKVTMLLDLPEDSDMLWKSIGAKRRAQAKRPIREGVSFTWGGAELVDDFYQVFCQNMRDLGTPVYSKSFFSEITKAFPQQVKIAIVHLNDQPVACGFLMTHQESASGKKIIEIPWASTLRKVNRIGVNMYLYWNILKHSIDDGFDVFDFGRSSKDAGTLKFKKQWGAVEKQLHWYYHLKPNMPVPQMNPNNAKYAMAIKVWQKMPLALCNFIGPHIIKGLP